jgi:hypothetical protein
MTIINCEIINYISSNITQVKNLGSYFFNNTYAISIVSQCLLRYNIFWSKINHSASRLSEGQDRDDIAKLEYFDGDEEHTKK